MPKHDETIVPVRPTLRSTDDPALHETTPLPGRSISRRPRVLALGIGAVLVLLAAGSFVWLPTWVNEQRVSREQDNLRRETLVAVPEEPAQPALSPEEVAALKARAESLLTNLLTQQNRLKAQSVESWGGDLWQTYSRLGSEGDDAFLAEDFELAVTRYAEATSAGERLMQQATQTVDGALKAAAAAFAAGNADLALRQYDIVLGIEPDNAAARAGRARAERLPEVLELVAKADQERSRGELEAALSSYREALKIDPGWEAATQASQEVRAAIANAAYERALSAGFGALAQESYAEAIRQFQAALAQRPGSHEAQDGLTQAEHGLELDRIALTEARALAFERRELWDQAVSQYRSVLAEDATLVFAQAGLERAEARLALDTKLKNLIENPTLLFSDGVLANARDLLTEAGEVLEKGPRLEEQIGNLQRLVDLASTPIAVRIESDQLTNVTLYRVGALGSFAQKEVALRPGTYTAIGSRDGYRDVRKTFTVLPGRELPAVSVVCVEPI